MLKTIYKYLNTNNSEYMNSNVRTVILEPYYQRIRQLKLHKTIHI